MSALGSLREALRNAEIEEEVFCFDTALNLGPIRGPDFSARAQWMLENLSWRDDTMVSREVLAQDLRDDWRSVCEHDDEMTIWYSSRSAPELCGLMAVVSARPRGNLFAVDAAHYVDVRDSRVRFTSSGQLNDQNILSYDLFSNALELLQRDRDQLTDRWNNLCAENADVRVVDDTGIASSAIDTFDQLLIDQTGHEWTHVLRVVGHALLSIDGTEFRQVGDSFLCARLDALSDTGIVELSDDGERVRRD